jgi:hypothetical protein
LAGVRERSAVIEDMWQIVVCSSGNKDDHRVMFEPKEIGPVSLIVTEGFR